MAKTKLKEDALKLRIQYEDFETYSERVRKTLLGVSTELIDKTIASMDTRIGKVIKAKGARTKY